MTLPREVLAEQVSATAQAFDAQRYGPSLLGGIDAQRAQRIADRLLAAKQPVVITSYLGRKAEAVGTPAGSAPTVDVASLQLKIADVLADGVKDVAAATPAAAPAATPVAVKP
jgi:acetolactate synthase-1/2/3 large subunit